MNAVSTDVNLTENVKPPSLWRNKEFNLLWGSQAFSGLGNAISGLAMPLLTLAVTGSPIQAGVVGLVRAGVQVACQMPIGVVTDRFDRRKLMLTADIVQFVCYSLLAWAVLTDRVTLAWIIVATVIGALFTVVHETSQFGAIRNIVALQQVAEATARNQARLAATNLAGPPIGGALFGLARSLPFLADAISYLISFIGILLIRKPMQQERTEPRGHPVKELAEGVRFTFSEPFLRTVVLVAPPLNVAINGLVFAVIVILQQQGTAPVLIGAAEAIIAAGALAGGLAAPWVVRKVPLRPLVIGGFWLFTILMATISPLLAGAFVQWWGGPTTVLAFAGIMSISALGATLSKGTRAIRPLTEPIAPA